MNEGLHGQDIAFTSITILDSPVFGVGSSVSLTCDSCFLEFTTGKFKQITIGFHQFQNGGSFSLDGTVNNAGAIIPAYTGFTGNILSGQFQGSPKPVVSASSSLTGVFTGVGGDEKNSLLVDHFGFGPNFSFTDTSIQGARVAKIGALFDCSAIVGSCDFDLGGTIGTVTLTNGGFIYNVDSADLRNFPAPEPATGLLLLLGVSALAASRRRRT